jgi:hypothetical protein
MSMTSDNEHAAPSLGDSEVSTVQHSVGEPIPEFSQRPEEGAKVSPSIGRQDAGHVFPDEPRWTTLAKDFSESEGKLATRVSHAFAFSVNAKTLARRSADDEVDAGNAIFCNVAIVRDAGVSLFEQGAAERVYLA